MITQTIFITQGIDFSLDLELQTDGGLPINVAGYIFDGAIRQNPYSQYQANLTVTITDAANGVVVFSMPAAQTAALQLASHIYTIVANTGNSITGLITGDAIVLSTAASPQPLPYVPPKLYDDEFVCSIPGDKDFYLSFTPANTTNVIIIINDVTQNNNANVYTLTTNHLNIINGCNVGDVIQAQETVYNY